MCALKKAAEIKTGSKTNSFFGEFFPARAFHDNSVCAHTEKRIGIKAKNKTKSSDIFFGRIFSSACFNSSEVVVQKKSEVICSAQIRRRIKSISGCTEPPPPVIYAMTWVNARKTA